jgi:hypothetical protein
MNPAPGSSFTLENCSSAAAAPTPPSTGAAYIVISHGENGAGAYSNQGIVQAAVGADPGTEEAKNAAGLAFRNYYVDDFASYLDGASHFDDFVLRPSILTVATKAQLGPRAH